MSAVRLSLLAIAFILAFAAPAAAQRLPGTAVPEHYTLSFAPDFTKDNFAGEETIAVKLAEPGKDITLNAAEIEFLQASITAGGQTQPAKVSLNAKNETATLTVDAGGHTRHYWRDHAAAQVDWVLTQPH